MRLHKWLADAGIGSRRACEALIAAGRVRVNGTAVSRPGTLVDPTRDRVAVDGREITMAAARVYYLFHKPAGVVTSLRDPRAGETIARHLTGILERVYPVGRLDRDAEGLLLLTNDGDLAFRLTHPRFKVWKTYLVDVTGSPSPEVLRRLGRGILLDDGRTAPAQARLLRKEGPGHPPGGKESFWVVLKIREGRKHQVKRMLEAVGYPVRYLRRVRLGPLRLGSLPRGGIRPLTRSEVDRLRAVVGLPDSDAPRDHGPGGRSASSREGRHENHPPGGGRSLDRQAGLGHHRPG